MAVAQGNCPNCGAPIEYSVGSSLAKVCEYCRATVVRSDRGLTNLGVVADLAETPSLIAVGDEGTLSGRPFKVFGRVQLHYGEGPWDEYYVAFDHGNSWGWLAYAQGYWHVTELVTGVAIPAYDELRLEQDVSLGAAGVFRISELKSAQVVSAEGELPHPPQPGSVRFYADLYGKNWGFATLDYGDKSGQNEVFIGQVLDETQLQVTELGPRSANKVKTELLRCPNCGGDVQKLSGERAERLGCPYCGALSDIPAQRTILKQEALRTKPDIPVSQQGTFNGIDYICTAYLRRGTTFEGEPYSWDEYLLWAKAVGFRWLVKDPETGWAWIEPVNIAELDLSQMPHAVGFHDGLFIMRNQSLAKVEYVLGEVYWKCQVGETTDVQDFQSGEEVLSREQLPGDVKWSHSVPIPWAVVAGGFAIPVDGPGGRFPGSPSPGGPWGSSGCGSVIALGVVMAIIMIILVVSAGPSRYSTYGGRGSTFIYYSGK